MSSKASSSPPLPRAGQQRAWWRAPGTPSGLAWAILRAAIAHEGPLLAVTPDNQQAHQLENDLRVLAGSDSGLDILPFPDWETLPYDSFSPHPEITSQRLATLHRLPQIHKGVVVVPVQTLVQRLAPLAHIVGGSFNYARGEKLDLDAEKRRLESAGYRNVPQVLDPGDFAVRGGLLDVFPMGTVTPYRIELFDDEIDTLRAFDPETQRSQDHVEHVRLLPGREVPVGDQPFENVMRILRDRFEIDTRQSALYKDLKSGLLPAGIEAWLPLFFTDASGNSKTSTLFDYLPASTLPVLCEDIGANLDRFWQQTGNRYEQRRYDPERPILPPAELYLTPDQLRERLNQGLRVEVCGSAHPRFADATPLGVQPVPPLPLASHSETPAAAFKQFAAAYPGEIRIAAESAGRREALLDVFRAAGIAPDIRTTLALGDAVQPKHISICVAPLSDGFALDDPLVAVLTEQQFFPERAAHVRRSRKAAREPEAIIRDLGELTEGAPIVHEDHGVGRYRGLITLVTDGEKGEYLDIEYAKGDRLYVPVSQLDLVSRYSGASPETAPLHSLGGERWTKAKQKAAEKVRDVAAELLDIQARRQARAGISLETDRALYEPFAASFPFEETPDQYAAIESVLRDLASSQPMDRVVCGDVGFGKTEVAVRAAFAAASAGKQVAVLVPTTLLAEQHYRNFRDRFADWPLKVEVLSRFKTAKETKLALERLERGDIDVIVGTHKLLSPDIRFKDLGLVIVDEEQRFGVRQKEALKALRANVHLLTLTATPIPRTLNMAMAGLRDLSIIATAPTNRLAVQTFVAPWDTALLREAFQRELGRGGQVYFLHNDLDSIERMKTTLEELIPEARIGVAHGQMPERELEQVMLDFQKQRVNVLLCSTIVESGIDIPNANTMIINRADMFGLAQLHQLRGRVGRSHHRAYAYLLIPDDRSITSDARKRLEAISSMDELGAGFLLATHDLEIRGAGELLGEDQSGQMTEVGFSLYTELLERAVRSIKEGKLPEYDADAARGAEVELHVPALIPDDYLPDVHTRLTLYKRISAARTESALRDLQIELIDRFGLLPDPVKHLFAVAELKLEATRMGIKKLVLGENGGRVQFVEKPDIDPMALIKLIQTQPNRYRMDGPQKLRIVDADLPDFASRMKQAQGLLTLLRIS
ncbi:transcription-repair coupling factor [Lysobacter soyae]|uniref:Transcription-repair-coupling factor n=1 Tax=Lysobacter soyae TaxID=2764185 RepID=A0ABX8WS79_9GAMM|nr:transcription-repair coupling factor [Lysobacter sp. CJ11]QYR53704.1 transcription-repair coupling factor [Lysobacter sp. CJ11]